MIDYIWTKQIKHRPSFYRANI